MSTTRKPGRPAKYPRGEKRPTLTFRVRERMHEQLQRAAEAAGRSLSEEIEYRIESSLLVQGVLTGLTGEDASAELMQRIAIALGLVQLYTKRPWKDDEDTQREVISALAQIIKTQFYKQYSNLDWVAHFTKAANKPDGPGRAAGDVASGALDWSDFRAVADLDPPRWVHADAEEPRE